MDRPMDRPRVAGMYWLEIGKAPAGWVREVVVDTPVDYNERWESLTSSKYHQIAIDCGTRMSKPFYEWIKTFVNGESMPQSGAIHQCDVENNILCTSEWHDGFISEVRFPALDAGSKDPANMSIKLITPEFIWNLPGSGKVERSKIALRRAGLPLKFRLSIPGCEEDCKGVIRIEAITARTRGTPIPNTKARVEFSDLVITLLPSHAEQFVNWTRSSAIESNDGSDQQRPGQLEYLTPDLQTPLFTLKFHDLRIWELSQMNMDVRSEPIRYVQVKLYVNAMEFNYDHSAA